MTSKNKVRGNTLEKEVEKAFLNLDIKAKRAWGSNGQAMGEHEEVDVLVPRQLVETVLTFSKDGKEEVRKQGKVLQAIKIQCKRKKKLPDWLGFTEHVDAVCVREDRGEIFVILKLASFIRGLK